MNPLALALLRLLARLPLPLLHGLGVLLGTAAWLIPNRYRRITLRNLELCFPDLTPAARRHLARHSLVETGKTLLETPLLWFASRERLLGLIREVRGEAVLERARTAGGVVMVTPHLGSWELGGLYLSLRHGITSLYRPPRRAALEATIRTARERLGARLVPTDAGGIRKLYQALVRGELIGILPDQDPRAQGGAFAPFFGVPANTMTLLPRLAHKGRAPVVFGFAERLPWGGGFRVHYLPAPTGIDSDDPAIAAAALNRGVEQCVRLAPAQYQWSYKRFRTRPPGEPPLY